MEIPRHTYDEKNRKSSVFKLQRSLYVLKDTAKICNKLLFHGFQKACLREMRSAPCIFRKKNLIVVRYVDDLVIFRMKLNMVDDFRNQMRRKFKIKDLRRPTQLPAIELNWLEVQAVELQQLTVINKSINQNGMQDARQIGSLLNPDESNDKLQAGEMLYHEEHHKYRSMVGSIVYLERKTHPDLALTSSTLRSHVPTLRNTHVPLAKRALRYLSATK